MNIALLHHSVPPLVGGVESVIAHHAWQMSAAGHHVRLVAARGESLGENIPLYRVPLVDSRHERLDKLKQQLDAGIVPPDFAALRGEIAVELQAALQGVDVLFAHNVCSLNKNLALTAALHQLHVAGTLPRLVLWHHDLAWTTPRYQPELHPGYPWDLLRADWGNTTQVVISELRRGELAELMSLAPQQIRVVPNGVDMARFFKLESQTLALLDATRLLDFSPILLLPARMTRRKNIELGLRALAELRKILPQAALVVTGPLGPHNATNREYFDDLADLRAALGLEEAAIFLAEHTRDYLPDEVIADFYRLGDALFFPSKEEGFGIPLLEAAFSHLPAFCADIPALRALGENQAIFFEPEADPAQVAEQVADFFEASPVSQLAMRIRATYRWDAIYQQHIAPIIEQKGEAP